MCALKSNYKGRRDYRFETCGDMEEAGAWGECWREEREVGKGSNCTLVKIYRKENIPLITYTRKEIIKELNIVSCLPIQIMFSMICITK